MGKSPLLAKDARNGAPGALSKLRPYGTTEVVPLPLSEWTLYAALKLRSSTVVSAFISPYVGLDASAADRAHDRTIVAHQHLRGAK